MPLEAVTSSSMMCTIPLVRTALLVALLLSVGAAGQRRAAGASDNAGADNAPRRWLAANEAWVAAKTALMSGDTVHGEALLRAIVSAPVCRAAEGVECIPGEVEAPLHARAAAALGNFLLATDQEDEAIQVYQREVQASGGNADVFNNLGVVSMHAAERAVESKHALEADAAYAAAERHYMTALQLDPGHASAANNLGLLYLGTGRLEDAAAVFERGMQADPSFRELVYNLGVVLTEMGLPVRAGGMYVRSLQLDPQHVPSILNLAALHHAHGNASDSAGLYQKVLDLEASGAPVQQQHLSMALTNLAQLRVSEGLASQAIALYERVIRIHSSEGNHIGVMEARMLIINARLSACDWRDRDASVISLVRDIERHLNSPSHQNRSIMLPFDSLLLEVPQHFRVRLAKVATANYLALPPLDLPPLRSSIREPTCPGGSTGDSCPSQLRIGYLCFDFNDHPTAHMIEGLFVSHNHSHVKSIAIGYGKDDGSDIRKRLQSEVDVFVNAVEMGFADLVAMARGHGLHVAIDLQGHTLGARMEVMSRRVAPIQASYLIFPGTMGGGFTDYVIADAVVAPPEHASHFGEKLVLLPGTYQVNYYPFSIPPPDAGAGLHSIERARDRAAVRLPPPGRIVYANFNKNDKLSPATFDIWMQALARTPGSVLWMLEPSRDHSTDSVLSNLRAEANARGIHHSRIISAARVPKPEHLSRLRLADIFLDSVGYGAHSTATDALRSGVPVVTCVGPVFAGRVGASLLKSLDLEHSLAHSMRDMVDTTVQLADSAALLRGSRRLLAASINKPSSAADVPNLFDSKGFTRTYEEAARAMWNVAVAFPPPEAMHQPVATRDIIVTTRRITEVGSEQGREPQRL